MPSEAATKRKDGHRRLIVAWAIIVLPLLGLGLSLRQAMSQAGGVCGSDASTDAHAQRLTTMVLRFNHLQPGGAEPIPLVDGRIYDASELFALVTAGYCGDTELTNRVNPAKGWIWHEGAQRFKLEP